MSECDCLICDNFQECGTVSAIIRGNKTLAAIESIKAITALKCLDFTVNGNAKKMSFRDKKEMVKELSDRKKAKSEMVKNN
jgi:hypothetical protein